MTRYKKLDDAIKGHKRPPQFVLIFGPDEGIAEQSMKIFIDNYLNLNAGIELRKYSSDDLINNFQSFETDITGSSLFGGAIAANIKLDKDIKGNEFAEILSLNIDGAVFITAGELNNNAKIIQAFDKSDKAICIRLYAPNRGELLKIASDALLIEDVKASKKIIEEIVDNSDQSSKSIIALIQNLALYTGKNGEITEEALEAMSIGGREGAIDEIINAAFLGNIKTALIRCHQYFLSDNNAIPLLNTIMRRIRLLLSIHLEAEHKSIDAIVKDPKMGIFWKEQAAISAQFSKWSRVALESVLNKAIETDIQSKQANIPTEQLIEKLIIGISEYAAKRN